MALTLHRTYLCPAPNDDPRPSAFDPAVIEHVVTPRLTALMAWVQYRVPMIGEDAAIAAVSEAIVDSAGDAFRTAYILHNELNWPSDSGLVFILHDMIAAIPTALRYEQRLWAVRTGLRFPGKEKDIVEWINDNGGRVTGEVTGVDHSTASGYCQPVVGKINRGGVVKIPAEWVFINRNQTIDWQPGFQVEAAPEETAAE